MKTQRIHMEYPADKLEKALNRVIDEQPFSSLRKTKMKKQLRKRTRHGTLDLSNMDTEWLYRLCCASLMLHDYHWFGWEWRSQFATELSTRQWVYPPWFAMRGEMARKFDLEDTKKKRILVVAEQGIGDEIVFASCYHELAQDVEEAWIEVDPRLIPIFERSFPKNLHFIDRFIHAGKNIVPRLSDYPKIREGLPIEAFIPAGNVPKLYRQSASDFPIDEFNEGFLKPNYDLTIKWEDWLLDEYNGARIGCSWRGRQGEIDPLDDGISLQYGTDDHRGLVVPPVDLKRDLDEVFALIAALDRVVTTTNAVAHMAGSLGVETHCVKPYPIYATKEDPFNNRVSPYWGVDYCDWYPAIRMYRSPETWRMSNAKKKIEH